MKLIFSYTLDYLKRNKRSSIAIMVAILMVSTMLSALCSLLYNMYSDNLQYILRETGDWHGELFDNNVGSDLEIAESFESVETTLIKGPWMAAAIDDPRRDYLVWRNADANYWQSMPEGNSAIMEGHMPAAGNEIALSKQYFEHHPDLKMGDILTLTQGTRLGPDGNVIEPQFPSVPGELFAGSGTVSLKVVGKLDVTTSSSVPAYTALGYMERERILPEDNITIYLRFKKIGDTYKELPKIAAAVGYQPDEYGEYNIRFNTDYLMRQLVFHPKQIKSMNLLEMGQMPLAFSLMGLLAAGVFVLVIHNAFSLSANARLNQLGVLASVGASPKQIKCSVLMEALLLSLIPLPVGLLFGHITVSILIGILNAQTSLLDTSGQQNIPMQFVINWLSVLPAVLLTLLTLWWSALIPASRVARLSPIEAMRQGEQLKLKKPSKHSPIGLLGIEGELALNAQRARFKSYRTAAISLTLSFMTLAILLCINSAGTAGKSVYGYLEDYKWTEKNIFLRLSHIASQEDYTVTKELSAVPGVNHVVWYNEQLTAVWLPPKMLSKEFQDAGGFEQAAKIQTMRLPLFRDGEYRILAGFVGLDDDSFDGYCKKLGIDPAPYYQPDALRAVLYNTIHDITTSTKRTPVTIPYLNVKAGDRFTFTEKTKDDMEGSYHFEAEIGAIADTFPSMGERYFFGRYGMALFLPMSRMEEFCKNFKNSSADTISGAILVDSPDQIPGIRAELARICESFFGSGDYYLYDMEEELKKDESGRLAVDLIFGFVAALFAAIGLSNAWATVRGTLAARRREFAMLRSAGLSPQGMRNMLILEAIMLGLAPILFCLPFTLVIQWVFLTINEITVLEWLPFAPWLPVLSYTVTVLAVILSAYYTGAKRLLKENIIDSIKLDTM